MDHRKLFSDTIRGIHSKPAPKRMAVKVIAVDGPGAAGKTVLAERLAVELGGAQIVHTDDFASWDNPLNWWPELIEQALEPLASGRPARYKPTSWGGEEREQLVIQPAEFVILEGVSSSREAFRPYLTYSIWIETPRDLRLERGLERDGEQARAQWEKWMAAEDEYIEREKPHEHADVVFPGDL